MKNPLYDGNVTTQAQPLGRNTQGLFEVVVDARPSGPPLTTSEQALRIGLVVAFFAMLAIESWLLWHAWAVWA